METTHSTKLEKISYSRISTFEQCPRRFLLKYEQGKKSETKSLALEIGTISHYGKELVGLALINSQKPDYEAIREIVMAGYDEQTVKIHDEDGEQVGGKAHETTHVLGIRELKEKYFFQWLEKDDKSGIDYDEKLGIYFRDLPLLEAATEWKPVACELEFDIDYAGLFRLYGFIDRIDQNAAGEYRVVDYKSSRKVFDDKYIATPLQMFIYTLAVEHMYQATPMAHIYDFMFLGKTQHSCTKGYYKRGTTKLLKLYNELSVCRETAEFKPKPSPLCHWCDYCRTNKDAADDFKDECPYYSLWTPNNKTFDVHMKYDGEVADAEPKAKGFWF
jgi:RecB family exonuclease